MSASTNLPKEAGAPAPPLVERRSAPRYRLARSCLVCPQGSDVGAQGWRCVAYDVSTTGIGLTLPLPPRLGTLLRVEAWALPALRPLRMRVTHVRPVAFLWFCGCALEDPLREGELRTWLDSPRG